MIAMYIFLALSCASLIPVGAAPALRGDGTQEAIGGIGLSLMAVAGVLYFGLQALGMLHTP